MSQQVKENTEIEELRAWGLPDTVKKRDGYDLTSIPEATSENMLIFMNKINELAVEVNRLSNLNRNLINALKR